MEKIYANYVEKYQNKMNECDKEFSELNKIRKIYLQKRKKHRIETKALLGILPMLILFLIAVTLVGKDIIHPMFVRYAMILGFVLTFFVIEPLMNKRALKNLEKYHYLIEGKDKLQIMLDDFNNYFERVKVQKKYEILEEVKKHNLDEMEKHMKLNKTLGELSKQCDVTIKSKDFSEKEICDMQDKKKDLLAKYDEKEKQFEKKIKEYSVVKFFDKFFKEDFMQTTMKLMMVGMCVMLYWNMPLMMVDNKNANSSLILLSMIIPFVACFVVYFLYGIYIKNIQKEAFKYITKELENVPSVKKTKEDLSLDLSDEIRNIKFEMVNILTSIDLIDIMCEKK